MDEQGTLLVTFVVPCYNSSSYMSRAVDSLLAANHPCEILLVNDGSSDDTGEVARAYAERHDCVVAIDQENSNWGGAVNRGLALARGRYFKVVDSDDRLEPHALHRVLDVLARAAAEGDAPDLLLTDYVYDHLPSGTRRTMSYRSFLPQGRTFGWDEVGRPGPDEFVMIHAAWYATACLRASGVLLPTGVSYMDSILLLRPMPYVRRLRYVDAAPYLYAIGREGQSINVDVIGAHIDEQIFANMLAIRDAGYGALLRREPRCAELMGGYIMCMMSVSTLNLFTIGTAEAVAKNDALWAYLGEQDPALHERIRRSWVGLANRRTPLGRFLAVRCYAIAKRVYKLA
jgi:glycosyltransferase involved in cell wall biosynthesis